MLTLKTWYSSRYISHSFYYPVVFLIIPVIETTWFVCVFFFTPAWYLLHPTVVYLSYFNLETSNILQNLLVPKHCSSIILLPSNTVLPWLSYFNHCRHLHLRCPNLHTCEREVAIIHTLPSFKIFCCRNSNRWNPNHRMYKWYLYSRSTIIFVLRNKE